MKIFLDTDVLLDVVLDREPHYHLSAQVWNWAEKNPGQCAVSWHGIANLHYLGKGDVMSAIRQIASFCDIPPTGSSSLQEALNFQISDFEDAMQCAAAMRFGADLICTRNLKDFRNAPIKALTPSRLIPLLPA